MTASVEQLRDGMVTYLKAYAGLVALVSTRLYPKVLPEGRTLPAVTYDIQSAPRDHYAGAVIAAPYIRFTAWSSTHTASWQIAQQLCLALDDYHGLMGVVHARMWVMDAYDGLYQEEPNPGMYPVHVPVRVWFRAE